MVNVVGLLALLLGMLPIYLPGVGVYLSPERQPYSGVMCDVRFGGVAGNAQYLCGDLPDRTIVLYRDALESPRRAAHVLAHESYHARNTTTGPAHDPFREAEAEAFACRVAPDWTCEGGSR